MTRPTPAWPPPEAERRLHAAFIAPDAAAPNDVASAFIEPLIAFLSATNPGVPEDLIVTAAGDAVLGLVKNPAAYNPVQLGLGAYLRMAARRDLMNLLESERRHHRRRVPFEAVEDTHPARNTETAADPGTGWGDPRLTAAVSALTPPEQLVLGMMRDGERRTEVFAERLGLGGLSGAELARVVKRFKDRLLKRLKRAAGGG